MPGFGKGTDYFGLGSASLVFIESSTTPMGTSTEDAQDEEGNIAGRGSYESGPADAIECVYHLLSSTLDLSTISLGYLLVTATKTCITSVDVSTSNSEWPSVTVSGYTGVTNETDMPLFALPAITINGKKNAQGLDFTVGADCRLTSSSLKASGELAHALDDDGEVGAMAFTGAVVEIGGDAVEIAGVVAWTPDVAYTVTQAPGASNSNIGWGTSSFAATKYLSKTVIP